MFPFIMTENYPPNAERLWTERQLGVEFVQPLALQFDMNNAERPLLVEKPLEIMDVWRRICL